MSNRPTILYDQNCHFCRNMAAWLQRHSGHNWQFRPQITDEQGNETARQLGIELTDQSLLWGQDAWRYLIANEPKLASIRWLGQKLGFEESLAGLAHRTGRKIRKICRKCPD